MACFLPFYDHHNPNVPSSLQHGVPATVNPTLQPHYCHPHSQEQMHSVINFRTHISDDIWTLTLESLLSLYLTILSQQNQMLCHGIKGKCSMFCVQFSKFVTGVAS